MNEKEKQRAFASSLGRMGSALLKTVNVGVNWLFGNELGYTSMGNKKNCVVNVAWSCPEYIDALSEDKKDAMRMGVFAHELLHQLLTNFEYTNKVTESMTRAEASIFMKFANTIEDPAIEYFAPSCFGGKLLDSLRYSIKRIYKLSPGIDKSPNAFSQLLNALINFGDMGIVKGKWTFPEAKEMFKKVAPIYNAAIVCPDSQKRIDYAVECMQITRPLWEDYVKEQETMEKLLEELSKFLKRSGAHILGDSEKDLEPKASAASKRRAKIARKMEAENKEGKGSGDSMDQNEEAEQPKNSESDSNSDNAADEAPEEKSNEASESNESSENEKADDSAEDGVNSSNNDSENSEDDPGKGDSDDEKRDSVDEATCDEEEAEEACDDSFEIGDDLFKKIEESLNEENDRLTKEAKKEAEAPDKIPDIDISGIFRGKATCLNRRMTDLTFSRQADVSHYYQIAKNSYSNEISLLTKTLKKLFESDREECFASTSGEYNIVRGSLGTSARIFDKRRDPAKLKNAAVVLLVDLSGSMGGRKVEQARKTAITMAESLSACSIPYYIMGFHADIGANAVHDHFVTWANKKAERESLITMEARGNNFDGYSIRYAAELLKKRSEDNKILFVISDGQPSSRKYCGSEGISDTIDAIRQSRKNMTVFGIALGHNCGPELLQMMYGKDFIHVEDEALLTNMLCKKLKKCLAKK
nr:VWA domain-containing protein [uncultured Butyrivibrio sp.]